MDFWWYSNLFYISGLQKKLENKFKCCWQNVCDMYVPFFTMLVFFVTDPPHQTTLMFLPQRLMIIFTKYAKQVLQKLNNTFPLENWATELHFWRHFDVNGSIICSGTPLLTSLLQYDRILGQQQLFMVNYTCGFNQLETGKYFEWIIINSYSSRTRRIWADI